MELTYENMITLVKEHTEYNSGVAGNKIAQSLGMNDGYEFNFFSDIFLAMFVEKKLKFNFEVSYNDVMDDILRCRRENIISNAMGNGENLVSKYVIDKYVKFDHNIYMYIPHIDFVGFCIDDEENVDALIGKLKKFKDEIELDEVHEYIDETCEMYERDDNYIEMLHEIANRVL